MRYRTFLFETLSASKKLGAHYYYYYDILCDIIYDIIMSPQFSGWGIE